MPVYGASFFGAVQVDEMHNVDSMIFKPLGKVQRVFIVCLFTAGVAFSHLDDGPFANGNGWNDLDHFTRFFLAAKLRCKAEKPRTAAENLEIIHPLENCFLTGWNCLILAI